MTEPTLRLRAMLEDVPRAPDRAFVNQIDALVQLDQAYALRRRRAWRRFAGDVVVASAILVPALGLGLASAPGLISSDHAAFIVSTMMLALVGWAATNRWASS